MVKILNKFLALARAHSNRLSSLENEVLPFSAKILNSKQNETFFKTLFLKFA